MPAVYSLDSYILLVNLGLVGLLWLPGLGSLVVVVSQMKIPTWSRTHLMLWAYCWPESRPLNLVAHLGWLMLSLYFKRENMSVWFLFFLLFFLTELTKNTSMIVKHVFSQHILDGRCRKQRAHIWTKCFTVLDSRNTFCMLQQFLWFELTICCLLWFSFLKVAV